jgi:hypothetical protein
MRGMRPTPAEPTGGSSSAAFGIGSAGSGIGTAAIGTGTAHIRAAMPSTFSSAPNGRTPPVTSYALAIDTALDSPALEMPLTELALEPDIELVWVAVSDAPNGTLRGIEHLRDLVDRVGTVPGFEWLRIERRGQDVPYAQMCGHARYGLAVELSFGDFAALVVPAGSPEYPQRECGQNGWSFCAHPAELLDAATAVALAYTYVTAEVYPTGVFELRDPTDRVRTWKSTKETRR